MTNRGDAKPVGAIAGRADFNQGKYESGKRETRKSGTENSDRMNRIYKIEISIPLFVLS